MTDGAHLDNEHYKQSSCTFWPECVERSRFLNSRNTRALNNVDNASGEEQFSYYELSKNAAAEQIPPKSLRVMMWIITQRQKLNLMSNKNRLLFYIHVYTGLILLPVFA